MIATNAENITGNCAQWPYQYKTIAMIVLNDELLLFNCCNQSSISTPEPFFTYPSVHIGQFDLTWVGALSSCSLGLVWRSSINFFYWLLRSFTGNWVWIPPQNSPIVQYATLETRRKVGRVNFRKDFWDFSFWGQGKNWPIADVPSNDPETISVPGAFSRAVVRRPLATTLSENTYCTSMEGIRIILVENLLPVKMNQ